MNDQWTGVRIWICGIVQGVGFRPFVYSLAVQYGLKGWVKNSSRGVEIEVNGAPGDIQSFIAELRRQPPPLARIDTFEVQPSPGDGYTQFEILHSEPQPFEFLPVSPDVSICSDCQAELFDPANRRYRYPFINCTNCGPRFSIIHDIPYDRPNTTMAGFPMCPDCQAEYNNPLDRRFHAQPIACPVCGPYIWLEIQGEVLANHQSAIAVARQMLAAGQILAVKGLGGYHLACDASNPVAVAELRRRKKRSEKPFALMAFNSDIASRSCILSAGEEKLLGSRERPVVLLEKRPGAKVAEEVAPGQTNLGVMLAYTPLHLLLLEPTPEFPELLVMTSGNLSEEPIAYLDEDARERLSPLAEAFLIHNRPIHMRVDDSVARVIRKETMLIRRSRGYAPDPVQLAEELPPILGAGAELKNTFCLTRQKYAFVSHHIGDLENLETLQSFETGIDHYQRLFRVQPELLACDLHPNYMATRYAQERAGRERLPLIAVQHHHAHLAACLADNGWTACDPVIGLSFDGTGLGTDGAVWGGEVLLGGYAGFQRAFHLAYVPLPGADQAIHKPARMALAHLWAAGIPWEADLPPVKALSVEERTVLRKQLEQNFNAPPTSSLGRLFDAISALLGIRQQVDYEGQAAMELEASLDPHEKGAYPFEVHQDIIDPSPLLAGILADLRSGLSTARLAARFHNSLVALALDICQAVRAKSGSKVVALSGGVWQNKFLSQQVPRALEAAGFQILIHHQLPTNDGCIALGQALVAYHQSHA